MKCTISGIECTITSSVDAGGEGKAVKIQGENGMSVNLSVSMETVSDSNSKQSPVKLTDELLVETAKQSFEQLVKDKETDGQDA